MSEMDVFYNTVINQAEVNPYQVLTESSLEEIQSSEIPGWGTW